MSAQDIVQPESQEQPRVEKLLNRYINKTATLEYQVESLNDIVEQKNERIEELEAQVEELGGSLDDEEE